MRHKSCFAIRASLDAAQPVAHDQNKQTANGRHTDIKGSKRYEYPSPPETKKMSDCKARDAQYEIENQTPKPSVADQMVEHAVEGGNKQRKENRREGHSVGMSLQANDPLHDSRGSH